MIKESLHNKLEKIQAHYESIEAKLSDPDIIKDQNRFRDLSKERAQIEEIVHIFRQYQSLQEQRKQAETLESDPDKSLQELAYEEIQQINQQEETLISTLQNLLIPKDPNDTANVFLEIRAGTGGDEAAIFAGDLYRMYAYYAESLRWKVEVISESLGEHGGYKEIVSRISGKEVYGKLKFESGAHRVQRVPDTETQGRIHTSACTIAVLPETEEINDIEINPADCRVDTYRASGAGGQHVNKTDSAIRITHIPTGVVVECQEDRSQHRNRAKAMALLKSRILSAEKEKQQAQIASTRRSLVGTGDRSERIRTYNFPQGRVTDHRINLTLYKLEEILGGDLDVLINALIQEHQADKLAAFEEESTKSA